MARTGCTDCTARGGVARSVDPGNGKTSYEVRQGGETLERFASSVAAATFARGKIDATIHRVASEA